MSDKIITMFNNSGMGSQARKDAVDAMIDEWANISKDNTPPIIADGDDELSADELYLALRSYDSVMEQLDRDLGNARDQLVYADGIDTDMVDELRDAARREGTINAHVNNLRQHQGGRAVSKNVGW